MGTEFWVSLPGRQYDRDTGWSCSALTVPGARLKALRMDGHGVPTEGYRSEGAHIYLSSPPSPVPDAAAKIELARRLVTFDSAVATALIGLAGTGLSGWIAYELGEQKKGVGPGTPETQPQVAVAAEMPSSASSTTQSAPPASTQPPAPAKKRAPPTWKWVSEPRDDPQAIVFGTCKDTHHFEVQCDATTEGATFLMSPDAEWKPLTQPPAQGSRMVISPNGATLFVEGRSGCSEDRLDKVTVNAFVCRRSQ